MARRNHLGAQHPHRGRPIDQRPAAVRAALALALVCGLAATAQHAGASQGYARWQGIEQRYREQPGQPAELLAYTQEMQVRAALAVLRWCSEASDGAPEDLTAPLTALGEAMTSWRERSPESLTLGDDSQDDAPEDSAASALLPRVLSTGYYYLVSSNLAWQALKGSLTPDAFEARFRRLWPAAQVVAIRTKEQGRAQVLLLHERWLNWLRTRRRSAEALRFYADCPPQFRPADQGTFLALHADLLREVGRLDECLALLESVDPEGLPGELRSGWEAITIQAYLDRGLSDAAAPLARRAWERAEASYAAGDPSAAAPEGLVRLSTARYSLLRCLQATASWSEAAARSLEFFEEEHGRRGESPAAAYYALRHGRALMARRPRPYQEACGWIERALAMGLGSTLALEARCKLLSMHLDANELERASQELDQALALDAARKDPNLDRAAMDLPALRLDLSLRRGDPRPAQLAARDHVQRSLERLTRVVAEQPTSDTGLGILAFAGRRALVSAWIRANLSTHPEGQGAEACLPLLLRLQEQMTLARSFDAGPCDLAQLRAELATEGRGILLFLPGRDRSHLLLIDGQQVAHGELPPPAALVEGAAEYVAFLAQAGRSDLSPADIQAERRLAQGLADRLLPEWAQTRMTEWSAAWISGLELFGTVPIEFLPACGERYLFEALPVLRLLSLPAAAGQAPDTERPDPAWDYLLLGDPAGAASQQLPRLGLDAKRQSYLSAPYPKDRARCLVGAQANRAMLAGQLSKGVRVLQFLTHAVIGSSGSAELILAAQGQDPERLGRAEIAAVAKVAAPQLVVLLACETGTGTLRRGDAGSSDLGGAWLQAGASAAIVTHGLMDYPVAANLTRHLNEGLAAGLSIAEALRSAMARAEQAAPGEAPFRLAQVQLLGLGQRPLLAPKRSSKAPVIVGLAAAAAGLGLFLSWRKRPVPIK